MYRSVRLPGTVDTNGTLTVDESPGNALLLYLQALTHHVRFRIGRIRVGTAIYVGLQHSFKKELFNYFFKALILLISFRYFILLYLFIL